MTKFCRLQRTRRQGGLVIYLQFLAFFLAPCVLVSAALLYVRVRSGAMVPGFPLSRGLWFLAAVAVVAVVYTTPWDSWLIRNSVWWYPPRGVLGTIFRVPFEEYLFMIGLTVLTGCWTLVMAIGRSRRQESRPVPPARRRLATGFWCALVVLGVLLAVTRTDALYLGSLFTWFGLPLAIQAFFGADVLRTARSLRLSGLALTPLLWLADAVAINAGAWQLSTTHTIGLRFGGFPVEEAVFFFLVNLLVVDTIVLVTHPRFVFGRSASSPDGPEARPIAAPQSS
jgi:lycopene cyclase domain-containing protein